MTPPTIRHIRTDHDRLVFVLDHDREVSLPIAISPRLVAASATQRANWSIGARGMSAHWPDVDEDIAVWNVLGIDEETYLRSLRAVPVG